LALSRRRLSTDEGFTLVETVVAMLVAALMFSALAATLVQTTRASLAARQNQQSVDLANDSVETVRNLSFASIAMDPTGADLTGDTRITKVGSTYYFDPDGTGTYKEPIYTVTGAGVVPHVKTQVHNGTSFSVKTYVTAPVDALVNANGDRRVTVIVEWTTNGRTHTRLTSTIVADTRRGLPLPKYTWTASVAKTVSRGGRLDLPATLVNKGARDSWNLAVTTKSSGGATLPWTFAWYLDVNGDGVWESTDTLLGQSGGVYNTGLLATDQVLKLVAVAYISASETLGTDTVSLAATSKAQPTAPQQPALSDAVTVNAPACAVAGCQYKQLYLHNWADVANVPTADSATPSGASVNQMNATAPTATTLFNYDTDRDTVSGRSLDTGGSGFGDLSVAKSMYWRYGVGANTTFAGTAYVSLYGVLRSLDPTGTGVVNVYLRAQNGVAGPWVNVGSASFTASPWGTSSLGAFIVPVTGLNFSVVKNALIEVEVQVGSGASGVMDFGYDTTSFAASLSMPYTAGTP
jgi:type II secretory pathway pseudopilin PulG